ncbi:MAG: thioredoxin domain-containing protein [Armatimonas sp.]
METGFLPHRPGQPEAINADSFDEDVLVSRVPVLVEFWAARCAACRRLAPELAALGVPVFTVNVDEELPLAIRCDVTALPTILAFAEGTERGRFVGLPTRAELLALAGTIGL